MTRGGSLVTVAAVQPPARFGQVEFDSEFVSRFSDTQKISEGWINGAFSVVEPGVFDYIDGDEMPCEPRLMERHARDGQRVAYRHESFWQCMDTAGASRLDRIVETLGAN